MKFFMAYSGGKDCTLALDRMINKGHQCVGLIVTVGLKGQYSYMHLFTDEILNKFSDSLGVPLIKVPSKYKNDAFAMYIALTIAKKKYGAEAICSGDIDYDDARNYIELLAKKTGLKAIFPLWHEERKKILNELLEKGYICRIKCVKIDKLPTSFLGATLNDQMINEFKKRKIDICGENGEYHTMVINGPIFKKELPFNFNHVYKNGGNAFLIADDK